MKNEMMISAWDSILPDKAAEERMLSGILDYSRLHSGAKIRISPAKRLIPIAASLVIIAGAVFFGIRSGFPAKDLEYTLPNGQTVVYSKGSPAGEAKLDIAFDGEQRALTDDELRTLFPTLTGHFDGFAFFDEAGDILHMECWVADEEKYYMTERGENVRLVGGAGQLKICASREGFPVTDCIVSGRESETELDGVPLKTGYFVSKPNSRGERTVIFFAEYTLDGMTVYTELSGDLSDKEQVGARLTETVGGMITSGSPDKYAIKNE